MSRYELLYIIPATYAETELQPVIDGITKLLTDLGAKLTRNDMVGKLRLTYPINKARFGYYILSDMDIETEKLTAVNEALRLHSDVLRHHVVVKGAKSKPLFKLNAYEEIDREGARRGDSTADREARARQGAPAAAKAAAAPVNMDEIDKKLDKILEGKIV
jgi:small subunit ribosomal protein S6